MENRMTLVEIIKKLEIDEDISDALILFNDKEWYIDKYVNIPCWVKVFDKTYFVNVEKQWKQKQWEQQYPQYPYLPFLLIDKNGDRICFTLTTNGPMTTSGGVMTKVNGKWHPSGIIIS